MTGQNPFQTWSSPTPVHIIGENDGNHTSPLMVELSTFGREFSATPAVSSAGTLAIPSSGDNFNNIPAEVRLYDRVSSTQYRYRCRAVLPATGVFGATWMVSSPLFVEAHGLVIATAGGGLVFAMRDDVNCTQVWAREIGASEVEYAGPVWNEDSGLVLFMANRTLTAVQPETGETVFQTARLQPCDEFRATPSVDSQRGTVYVTCDYRYGHTAHVFAIHLSGDARGTQRWNYTQPTMFYPVVSSALVVPGNGTVVFHAGQYLAALKPDDGSILWRKSSSTGCNTLGLGLALARDDTLLLYCTKSAIHAVHTFNGAAVWSTGSMQYGIQSGITTFANDMVWFLSSSSAYGVRIGDKMENAFTTVISCPTTVPYNPPVVTKDGFVLTPTCTETKLSAASVTQFCKGEHCYSSGCQLDGKCRTDGTRTCRDGYWGSEYCDKECVADQHCSGINTPCDDQTGICDDCAFGYFGHYCNVSCANCKHSCDRDQGVCTQLGPGNTCNEGFWGPHCMQECVGVHCHSGCNSTSGFCLDGGEHTCDSGWWDKATCNQTCPSDQHCWYSGCRSDTGTCFPPQFAQSPACDKSWWGSKGDGSLFTCDKRCTANNRHCTAADCDPVDGACMFTSFANRSYHGTNETVCQRGYFGVMDSDWRRPVCNQQCPTEMHCAVETHGRCDSITGDCPDGVCAEGYWGEQGCGNECRRGMHCALAGCAKQDGSCREHKCAPTSTGKLWQGKYCDVDPNPKHDHSKHKHILATVAGVSAGVFVLIAIAAFVWYRRRKARHAADERRELLSPNAVFSPAEGYWGTDAFESATIATGATATS